MTAPVPACLVLAATAADPRTPGPALAALAAAPHLTDASRLDLALHPNLPDGTAVPVPGTAHVIDELRRLLAKGPLDPDARAKLLAHPDLSPIALGISRALTPDDVRSIHARAPMTHRLALAMLAEPATPADIAVRAYATVADGDPRADRSVKRDAHAFERGLQPEQLTALGFTLSHAGNAFREARTHAGDLTWAQHLATGPGAQRRGASTWSDLAEMSDGGTIEMWVDELSAHTSDPDVALLVLDIAETRDPIDVLHAGTYIGANTSLPQDVRTRALLRCATIQGPADETRTSYASRCRLEYLPTAAARTVADATNAPIATYLARNVNADAATLHTLSGKLRPADAKNLTWHPSCDPQLRTALADEAPTHADEAPLTAEQHLSYGVSALDIPLPVLREPLGHRRALVQEHLRRAIAQMPTWAPTPAFAGALITLEPTFTGTARDLLATCAGVNA